MKLLFIFLALSLYLLQVECYRRRAYTRLGAVEADDDYGESSAENDDAGEIWALLVAGSNGWYNYRHQADVAHAYHTLKQHGVKEDNIVTMMYDDIANNQQNPYPGQLFNSPNGKDVYKGVKVDYKGADVNPENFLAILQGDESGVSGGNGKVLKSNEKDKIFVFFSDHGATGLIAFPNSMLTVKQLNDVLLSMHNKKKYKEFTFYLEACESGSMFENVLPKNINIYAITAANSHESSWGCYCENPQNLPCLGDLFSVNWIQDSDQEDLSSETLEDQFEIVKRLTNKSHVMHYGDLNIATEHVAEFQGHVKANKLRHVVGKKIPPNSVWPVRDIPILMLKKQLEQENDEAIQEELSLQIRKIEKKRQYLEKFMKHFVKQLIHDRNIRHNLLNRHPRKLTKLDCHNEVTHVFNKACFDFNKNPYALKYVYVLANLCEYGLEPQTIKDTMIEECADIDIVGIH
jgi:legumain